MSVTSADSSFVLIVAGIIGSIGAPVPISDYEADDMFTGQAVTLGETRMGADGNLVGAFVPYKVPLEFILMPNAASVDVMDAWRMTETVAKRKYVAQAEIAIPAVGKLFSFIKGYLVTATVFPSAGRTLKGQRYSIDFQGCIASPLPG